MSGGAGGGARAFTCGQADDTLAASSSKRSHLWLALVGGITHAMRPAQTRARISLFSMQFNHRTLTFRARKT
jgi:hypothetical protein